MTVPPETPEKIQGFPWNPENFLYRGYRKYIDAFLRGMETA